MITTISWVASLILEITRFGRVYYNNDAILCEFPEEWMLKVFFIVWFIIWGTSFILMAFLYSRVVCTFWFKRKDGNILSPKQQVTIIKFGLNFIV